MTNVELWINITIIVLLLPTIFYAVVLSQRLGKMQQNQQRMIELAQALQRTAEAYGAAERNRSPQPCPAASAAAEITPEAPFPEPQSQPSEPVFTSSPEVFFRADHNGAEPSFSVPPVSAAEEPSEAELELLQALRSIK